MELLKVYGVHLEVTLGKWCACGGDLREVVFMRM